ncbi:MAG: zinc ribbon domain-containing protein, partial [Burkholderiales bacterium]|nr:zinc ribbon domain-containing protein [Burkholderiales bacterium]
MSNEHITLHTQALAANPDLAFFWEATKKESMLLPHCADCGKTHWHPRLFCPFCFSNKLEWKESAGKATLYAATTLSKASEPYIVAYVELAEGPL